MNQKLTAVRKSFSGLLCAALLGASLPAYAEAELAAAKISINIRSEASLSSKVVAVVKQGKVVTVEGTESEFSRVRTEGGKVGYLKTKYLTPAAPGPVVTTAATAIEPEPQPAPAAVEAAPTPSPVPPVAEAPVRAAPAPTPEPAPVAQVKPKPVTVYSTPAEPSPWSFRAGAGMSLSGVDAASLQSTLQQRAGGTVTVSELDDTAPAFSLAVGYQLHPNWSVETGVLSLGEFQGSIRTVNSDSLALRQALEDAHPVGGAGLSLAVQGMYPVGAWQFSAQLGAFHSFDTKIELGASGTTLELEGTANSLLIGGGIGYAFTPHWSLGLSLTALDLNDSVLAGQLGLQYRP